MIRNFIQCKSVKERLEFMLSTTVNDWNEVELTTIMQVLGLSASTETSMEGKWAIILNNLLLKNQANEKEIIESDKIFHDVA